jgi:signal peptidase I
MEPNFHDGEYLLTDKISYRFNKPNRGDVIIFKAPGTSGDDFIKRIIGLPGETVSVMNGKVYVNDTELNEKYLPLGFTTGPGLFLSEGTKLVVPQEKFFVLGDNRNHSADSRSFGFIEKSTIIGRAWFLYWPISNLGIVKAVNY